MAKTFNLNPGSDATLVAAATKAAMANVPKDLSGTFESVAQGYDSMMQNIGKAYGEGLKQTVTLGKKVVANAMAENQTIAKASREKFTIGDRGIKTEEQVNNAIEQQNNEKQIYLESYKVPAALQNVYDGKTPTTKQGIKELQKELKDAGYDIGEFGPNKDGIDGKIGDVTQAAIDSFKESHKARIEREKPVVKSPSETTEDKEISVDSKIEQDLKLLNKSEQDLKEAQKTEQEPMTIGSELKRIRKELRGIGIFGVAFKEEDIKRKYDLLAEKDQYLAQLKVLENAENFTNESLSNGTVDIKATGNLNLVAKMALTAYGTKSGVIEDGDYKGYKAELAKNQNDELVFRLVTPGPNGQYVTGLDLDGKLTTAGDKPYSVPVKNLYGILNKAASKADIDAVDKMFSNIMSSKSTVYPGNLMANRLKERVASEDNLHVFMNRSLGDNPTSFVEDSSTPSVTSATLFASLGTEALSNMGGADIDNDDDIDIDDFIAIDGKNTALAEENFKRVRQAIVDKTSSNYNEETTRGIFLEYAKGVGEEMYKLSPGYQSAQAAIRAGNRGGRGGGSEKSSSRLAFEQDKIYDKAGKTQVSKDVLIDNVVLTDFFELMIPYDKKGEMRESVPSFSPQGGKYDWNVNEQMYYYIPEGGGEDVPMTGGLKAILATEFGSDYISASLNPFTKYVPDWKKASERDVARYAGYTMDSSNTKPEGRSVQDAMDGNYYSKEYIDNIFASEDAKDKISGGGIGQKYDDVDVAELMNKKFHYFEFKAVGSGNRQYLRVNLKEEFRTDKSLEKYWSNDTSPTASNNVWNIAKDLRTGEISAWVNAAMKEVAEHKLETGNVKINKNIVGQIYETPITRKMVENSIASGEKPGLTEDMIGDTLEYKNLGAGRRLHIKVIPAKKTSEK